MPVIGWFTGCLLSSFIESFSHILASLLLAFVGIKMIYESINSEEGCREEDDYFKPANLILLSFATSIDAFAAGFAFLDMETGIIMPAAAIGIITFGLSVAGTHAGSRIGLAIGKHAETAGGVVLLLISAYFILRHYIH